MMKVSAIEQGGWFDTEYYVGQCRAQNLDVSALVSADKAYEHYASNWQTLDLNPHPMFWTRWYLASGYYSKRGEERFGTPLAHYVLEGAADGTCPCPFVVGAEAREWLDGSGNMPPRSPRDYPIWLSTCRFSDFPARLLYFDKAFYRRQFPEVAEQDLNPIRHLMYWGASQGATPTPLFDPLFYALQYADLESYAGFRFAHYVTFGYREGRFPNFYFTLFRALARTPSIAEFQQDAARMESCLAGLCPEYYRFQLRCHGAEARKGEMLSHYLGNGMYEYRDMATGFCSSYYVTRYPDIKEAGVDPLMHFMCIGAAEGRSPNPSDAARPRKLVREGGSNSINLALSLIGQPW